MSRVDGDVFGGAHRRGGLVVEKSEESEERKERGILSDEGCTGLYSTWSPGRSIIECCRGLRNFTSGREVVFCWPTWKPVSGCNHDLSRIEASLDIVCHSMDDAATMLHRQRRCFQASRAVPYQAAWARNRTEYKYPHSYPLPKFSSSYSSHLTTPSSPFHLFPFTHIT